MVAGYRGLSSFPHLNCRMLQQGVGSSNAMFHLDMACPAGAQVKQLNTVSRANALTADYAETKC